MLITYLLTFRKNLLISTERKALEINSRKNKGPMKTQGRREVEVREKIERTAVLPARTAIMQARSHTRLAFKTHDRACGHA